MIFHSPPWRSNTFVAAILPWSSPFRITSTLAVNDERTPRRGAVSIQVTIHDSIHPQIGLVPTAATHHVRTPMSSWAITRTSSSSIA